MKTPRCPENMGCAQRRRSGRVVFDQSLVQQTDDGADEPRFTMLDTLRDYARERLADCP